MKFLRRLLVPVLVAASALVAIAAAAPAGPQDLGQGLAYVRVRNLAEDDSTLEAALSTGGPLVVDLRQAAARPEDAKLLEHALGLRRGRELLCVLVGPGTSPALAGILTTSPVHFTTLGIRGSVPAPRVVIEQPAEKDRAAYAAWDAGTPLATLVSGKIEKDRYDEASLMNDFSNGNTSGEPPEPDPTAKKAGADKPAPLVDRVLQRAINLHRALAAIKARS